MLSLTVLSVFLLLLPVTSFATGTVIGGDPTVSPSRMPEEKAPQHHPSLAAGQTSQLQTACGVHVFLRTVSYPNCTSKVIKIQGCLGYCESFSVPTFLRGGPPKLTNTCRCCRPASERTGYVRIRCHVASSSIVKRVNIRAATKCHCRPCSELN